MRFDDRLMTVLGLYAEGPHERAVQWRQLVELIARGAAREQPSLREQALGKIAALMREVPEEVRAAAARSIAGADVPAELVALFAADKLEVAAPLLTAAELDPAGWAAVSAVASPSVAAMLAALRPAPAAVPLAPPPVIPTLMTPAPSAPSLQPVAEPESGTPLDEEPMRVEVSSAPRSAPLPTGVFRWECGPNGQIDWVEGVPRAALIGRSLADDLERPFVDRLPFEDERLVLAEEGSLAGEWRWSGTPAFSPDTGRFTGYRGVARREGGPEPGDAPASAPLDSDSLRELVHELRTPLNAIIGFSEIIGGQYLGPAHRPYRERAQHIVEQGRRLLEAVEDLDFAARVQSGRQEDKPAERFDQLFTPIRLALLEQAVLRDVTLTAVVRGGGEPLAVGADLAGRLLRRFLTAVVGAATPGERLELVADRLDRTMAVAIDRPDLIRDLGEEQLFEPSLHADERTRDIGFTLRLVRGLAAIAQGVLDVGSERLVLRLPLART